MSVLGDLLRAVLGSRTDAERVAALEDYAERATVEIELLQDRVDRLVGRLWVESPETWTQSEEDIIRGIG